MPFTSEEAGAAIKGRFGSHEHHHRSVEKSVMSPVKSSPNLILKAEIKDSAGIHSSSSSSVNRSFVRETGKDQFVQDIDRIPQLSECVREESWETYICTRPPKSQYVFDYISNQNIPILNEEYFYTWKHGMRVLMDSIDERLFECVSKGPLVPMKVNTDPKTTAKNPFIKKPEQEWTEKDEASASIDGKASYIISRGLETSAYQQVVNCTTAKEMWDAIEEYIDGDDEASVKKLYLYIQQFNNFRKDPKETLRQAYDRFSEDIDRIPQLSECVREESWQTYICTRPPKSLYAFDYISNQNIPILNEEYLYIWKHSMRVLMDSIDERLFECVSKGPLVPMKVNTDPKTTAKNPFIKKPEQEWTEKDEASASIDGKASYIISRGLETSAYQQVVNCTTAKEMWDAIDEYIDGDDEARAKKLYLYIQQFNNFRKDPKETLRQAYDRFSEVRCRCYALGKEYTNKELNMRFLSGLDSQWFMKTVSIEDTKDLNQMTPLSLYSNLRNYEFLINECRRKEFLGFESRQ